MTFGTVKYWDSSKGFGFISTDEEDEIFLHVSDLSLNLKPADMKEGLRVKFDIKSDMRGDKAINVRKA